MAEVDDYCNGIGIPARLHTLERLADQAFSAAESLYRRIDPAWVKNGKPAIAALSFDEMSVNREKYTEAPEDVLFDSDGKGRDFSNWGVARINIGKLLTTEFWHPQIAGKVYTLQVEHQPVRCMFPHCVVDAMSDGKRVGSKMNGIYKANFKDLLLAHCEMVVMPKATA